MRKITVILMALLLIVIVCNRFLPFVFFSRTKGEWLSHWTLLVRLLIYMVMPVTLVLGFLQSVASLTRENTHEEPETSAEAVSAHSWFYATILLTVKTFGLSR